MLVKLEFRCVNCHGPCMHIACDMYAHNTNHVCTLHVADGWESEEKHVIGLRKDSKKLQNKLVFVNREFNPQSFQLTQTTHP